MVVEPFVFVFGILAIGLVIRLMAGSFDRDRITGEVTRRGGRVESIEWAPFGRGWFGERGDRIYNVTFTDGAGLRSRASCKTSMFSGVYWHEEQHEGEWVPRAKAPAPDFRPAGSPPPSDEMERLREENQRLRDEIARRGH